MVEEIKEDATVEPANGEEVVIEEEQELEAAPILISAEEWEAVQVELAEARAQVDENLDGWQRALADFSNYKKRLEREKNTVHQNALGKVILHYLAIVDDLELRVPESASVRGRGDLGRRDRFDLAKASEFFGC